MRRLHSRWLACKGLVMSALACALLSPAWAQNKGPVRIGVLAPITGPLATPGAEMIASVTFIAILMTILIQAPTTKWLGGRLGLLEDKPPR